MLFFHLTTTNKLSALNLRLEHCECVCEVNPIKVHQQVPATVHHTELHIQSYTNTDEWIHPDVWL